MRGDRGDAAVVLGDSIAGLLAARVLVERFATVVVVERDRLPDAAESRRGVPQARHIHALLAGGQQAFEKLLPGLTHGLEADGVPVGVPLADVRLCLNGHRFRQAPSGLALVSASREMLEHHLPERVRALPNVTLTYRCDVVGQTETGGWITGVRVLPRTGHSDEELVNADLFVGATGLGSRAPVWLSQLGFPGPDEEQLRVDLGYTTRRYRLPAETLDGDLGLLQAPTPARPRAAALARLEHRGWMLTLIDLRGALPPTNPDDFDRSLLRRDRTSSGRRSAPPCRSTRQPPTASRRAPVATPCSDTDQSHPTPDLDRASWSAKLVRPDGRRPTTRAAWHGRATRPLRHTRSQKKRSPTKAAFSRRW